MRAKYGSIYQAEGTVGGGNARPSSLDTNIIVRRPHTNVGRR